MIYKVKASFLEHKASDFLMKLTDGSIQSQQPDGGEIVASMKRAKITSPGSVEWCEMCFCPTPLQHERATVYDQYFENIATQPIDQYQEVQGDSFWDYLKTVS